ncbi:MAG: Tfp pilus assembly protein FimT/FimU [Maricaulaceae bacterium]
MAPRAEEAGVTLIEVLIVLGLIAVASALAVPAFGRLQDAAAAQFSLAAFETDLAQLRLDALTSGRPFYLVHQPLEAYAGFAPLPGVGERRVEGVGGRWVAVLDQPLLYRADGLCSGGRVVLTAPSGQTLSYVLDAPFCRVEPALDAPPPAP